MTKMDPELEAWPSLYRDIKPIAGGIDDLRSRIAAAPIANVHAWRWSALAVGALCAAALSVYWMQEAAPEGQRATASSVGQNADRLPHPRAVSLGLADPVERVHSSDSRIDAALAKSGDREPVLVFQWVKPRRGHVSDTTYVAVQDTNARHISEFSYATGKGKR